MPPDDRQHRDCERNVGSSGDGPTVQLTAGATKVDEHEQQRRDGDATECGGDGDERAARIAQITEHELALQLQAHHKEKDGEEPVGSPVPDGQLEV